MSTHDLPDRVAIVTVSATEIRADAEGFYSLARLHKEIGEFESAELVIDMSSLSWMDGHLGAALMTIVRHAQRKRNIVRFSGLRNELAALLRRNGFFARRAEDGQSPPLALRQFGLVDGVKFSLHAKRALDHPGMPKMSDALRSKFFEGIDELFANCALHSRSPIDVAACGQFFPQKQRLDFVLCDGGMGIPGAVRQSFPERNWTDEGTISWAMEPYNTTRGGDIPGGLGSKLIREFIALNKGRFAIASQSGYWEQSASVARSSPLALPYPGTVVLLEINMADKNAYDLVKAPDPRDIW